MLYSEQHDGQAFSLKKNKKQKEKLPTVIQPLQVNTDTYGHATSTIHCDHTLKRKHTGKVSYIGFCCTFYFKKNKKNNPNKHLIILERYVRHQSRMKCSFFVMLGYDHMLYYLLSLSDSYMRMNTDSKQITLKYTVYLVIKINTYPSKFTIV